MKQICQPLTPKIPTRERSAGEGLHPKLKSGLSAVDAKNTRHAVPGESNSCAHVRQENLKAEYFVILAVTLAPHLPLLICSGSPSGD